MSWIETVLEKTQNALRFKSVGLRVQRNPIRLLDTVPVPLDEFFHADISSVNYTVLAETPSGKKETFNVNVVAGISGDRLSYSASISVFGRVSLDGALVDITATVDSSKCTVLASPTVSETVQVKVFPLYMETIYGD